MSVDLRTVLAQFRSASKTEREKGTYFERLAVAFIKNDPGMEQEYEDAWLYADWAKLQDLDGRDTGIDAVAKIRGEDGFCAIQCKFYRDGHHIQKADIDSFFTASGKSHFSRRLIIDTTDAPWSANAEAALDGQQIVANRIGLDRLEQSPIDWGSFLLKDTVVVGAKKEPRQHQIAAIQAVRDGFAQHDRGKLIMACGTGKTFTALKIAEEMAGAGRLVLFLVPSLSLMSQSVREWTIDSKTPLRSFAVCSDVQVGKRRRGEDDLAEIEAHDLDYPATTKASKLAEKTAVDAPDRMTVVFATYQSIEVVAEAQAEHGLPEFDLIICDEAHRTTGARYPGEEDSNFVRVHDQSYLRGAKRLYMTATPRVFGDGVKSKASEASVELCSMDDEAMFGPTFFSRGFGWAVEKGLLTDYKVIVLAVDETMVSASIQKRIADAGNELKLDDATKIVGCYKALSKAGLKEDVATDPQPMHRALAFCKDIASSRLISSEFAAVVADYLASDEAKALEDGRTPLGCELAHVDGTFNAKARTERLEWLKASTDGETCRILTNARCLSEGVDVPALDAILFLHPRKSQIDVVQSVGRVMRRAEGKRMGYVILPIGVPAGVTPEEALADNERYRVVWQILNALRSHDERFDATINKLDLGVDVSNHIEVVAVTNKLPTKSAALQATANIGHGAGADDDRDSISIDLPGSPSQTEFVFDEFAKAIMAKIVKKCGKRDYWEDWATDIAKIAQTHITRIAAVVGRSGKERDAFERFLDEIRDDLNESITEAEAIEMLAQHIITKPVFEALFEGYSFAKHNPVSLAMQSVLDILDEQNLEKEAESLQKFYDSVKRRASGIDSAEGKQRIIVELYDKFFRNAFPKMTEKLGIVYTPVEVVDFIIRSVNDVLEAEFGQTLGSQGVHILDPFVGTGTFITRLLQSGLIKPEELEHKYAHELHANEIVLLAYYIAAINIEAAYHSLAGGDYKPFEGICLTDTFQLYEKEDMVSALLVDNSSRRQKQKKLDIRVIVGNPPYSVGQGSANDFAANVAYPVLDESIAQTFAEKSSAANQRNLYDSYIRAFRWASDRIGDAGVVGFVTNAGWLDGNAMDGFRKCLVEEFNAIYVFNLRGDARTSGERRRKEKDNVFGQGTRTPVAITLLVKNPSSQERGKIHIYDIGDYLSRDEKLAEIRRLGGISGVSAHNGWQIVEPDSHGDWLKQRDPNFSSYFPMGAPRGEAADPIFEDFTQGLVTARDVWCYNSSRRDLRKNILEMIENYHDQVNKLPDVISGDITNYLSGSSQVSWSRALRNHAEKRRKINFEDSSIRQALYRPFFKQWTYFHRHLNEYVVRLPSMFPTPNVKNLCILTTGRGAKNGFSALMCEDLPDFQTMFNGQCFPLVVYDGIASGDSANLFGAEAHARDGLAEAGLEHFRKQYPGEEISKEDVFYYIYGLLHSEEFRERFADNLAKELPRIPCVKKAEHFWAFVKAGRALGDLHVNYESVEPYPVVFKQGSLFMGDFTEADYRVEKMKFGGKGKEKDRTTVIYNSKITMTGIPLEAYDYVVNGKPALEWVMERQVVKTDKESGIVNDANHYAVETVGDPAYPLKLFQRMITVSLETMKILRSLPLLEIADAQAPAATISAAGLVVDPHDVAAQEV